MQNTPTSGFDFYEFMVAHPIVAGLFFGGISFFAGLIGDPQFDDPQSGSIEWGIGLGVLGFFFGVGLFSLLSRRHRRAEEEWQRAEEERKLQDQDAQGAD